MKKFLGILPIALLAFLPFPAAYAQLDVTGTWQAEVDSGGRLWIWTVNLGQDGDTVSGTVEQGIGDVAEIDAGRVVNGIVEFRVDIPEQRIITFTGTISGDEIAFRRNVEVRDGGSPGGFGIFGQPALSEFTARRVPGGQPPKKSRGGPLPRRLTIYDRSGEFVRTIGEPRDYRWPALSPDGRQLAVVIPDTTQGLVVSPKDPGVASAVREVHVFDLATGQRRVVASAPELRTPIWSPDGSRLAYVSYRQGRGQIHQRAANGGGPEELLLRLPLGVASIMLHDFSSDGRLLVFDIGSTLQVLPLSGGAGPVELLREEYSVYGAGLSFDDDLVAYLSNEGSGTDVYVRAFDAKTVRFAGTPVKAGAVARDWVRPRYTDRRVHWRDDADELYYQNEDREIMAVSVTRDPELRVGPPRVLFAAPSTGMHEWYDLFASVGNDGEQFVFAVPDFPNRPDIARDVLAGYTGTYRIEPDDVEFVVTLDGGELRSRRSDEPEVVLPMVPVSEQTFYSQRLGEEIDFVTDRRGDVTHLVVYDGGVGRWAVRVEESE